MPDYSKGKIYKIWSPSTGLTYIGSTTQSLSKRMGQHRNSKDSSCRQIFTCKDVRIDLIEQYPCSNKEELNRREGELIQELECVNVKIPCSSVEEYCRIHNVQPFKAKTLEYSSKEHELKCKKKREYHWKNREIILKKKREYCEKNRQKILEKKREYYQKNQKEFYAKRREYFIAWGKRKVNCECGCEISRGKLRTHQKTQKHQELLKKQLEKSKETPTNTGKSMENYERSVDELLKTMEKFRESVENYCM